MQKGDGVDLIQPQTYLSNATSGGAYGSYGGQDHHAPDLIPGNGSVGQRDTKKDDHCRDDKLGHAGQNTELTMAKVIELAQKLNICGLLRDTGEFFNVPGVQQINTQLTPNAEHAHTQVPHESRLPFDPPVHASNGTHNGPPNVFPGIQRPFYPDMRSRPNWTPAPVPPMVFPRQPPFMEQCGCHPGTPHQHCLPDSYPPRFVQPPMNRHFLLRFPQRRPWVDMRRNHSHPAQPPRPVMGSQSFVRPNAPLHRKGSKKLPEMTVVKTFGDFGGSDGQFNTPQGLCLGPQDDILVADTQNHRIQIFDHQGVFKRCWGVAGASRGCLWHPRKVVYMQHSDRVAVSDRVNGCSRIQIFDYNGMYLSTVGGFHDLRMALNTTTAGMTAWGDHPPACLIAKDTGALLSWFSLEGIVVEPSDVTAANNHIFISDFRGHCIYVFNIQGQLVNRIGGHADGVIQFPRGLGLTPTGLLLVGDTDTNRLHASLWDVNRLEFVGQFVLEKQKVSHCCGIAMNSAGLLVTAIKKNHHVLMLRMGNSARDWPPNH